MPIRSTIDQSANVHNLPPAPALNADFDDAYRALIHGEKQVRPWRQKLAGGLAVASIALASVHYAAQADQMIAEATVWRDTGVDVVPVGYSESEHSVENQVTHPDVLVLAIHGFNGRGADSLAVTLQEIIDSAYPDQTAQYYSLHYASDRVDYGEIFGAFDRVIQTNQPERVVIYGQSMGGIVGLDLLARLDHKYSSNYSYEDGHRLEGFTLLADCAPLSYDDLTPITKAQGSLLSGMREVFDTDGGLATRFVVELASHAGYLVAWGDRPDISRPSDKVIGIGPGGMVNVNLSYLGRFGGWFRDQVVSGNRSPNSLARSQYQAIIGNHDYAQKFASIGDRASIVQLRPAEYRDDGIVNDLRVTQKLRQMNQLYGTRVAVVELDGTGHANIELMTDTYAPGVVSAFRHSDSK